MSQGADLRYGELLPECFALRMANCKKMPNRFGPLRDGRENQTGTASQSLLLAFGDTATPLIPFVELVEFHPQKRRL